MSDYRTICKTVRINSTERNWLYSGAIGPLTDGIVAAPQVEPGSEAARALDEVANRKRPHPDDEVTQIQDLIAKLESS